MTKKMKEFKEKCKKNMLEVPEIVKTEKAERIDSCRNFVEQLKDILKEKYEIRQSCNKDCSLYLIPIGTSDQITYYGKPILSFRMSDHWNWYSKKCKDPNYIQCECPDLPRAKRREDENHGTNPIRAVMVAIQLSDGKYHHVFGERYLYKTKSWIWEETMPEDICREFSLI